MHHVPVEVDLNTNTAVEHKFYNVIPAKVDVAQLDIYIMN